MATKKKAITKKTTMANNRMGRPTKYDHAFCDIALEALRKGFSKEAVAGHLGICKDTLYRWEKEHKEFSDALKQGVELSRIFWEQIALNHLTHTAKGKQLNSTTWIFNMKNRFGWTDKKEIDLGEKTLPVVKLAYNLEEDEEESDEENGSN